MAYEEWIPVATFVLAGSTVILALATISLALHTKGLKEATGGLVTASNRLNEIEEKRGRREELESEKNRLHVLSNNCDAIINEPAHKARYLNGLGQLGSGEGNQLRVMSTLVDSRAYPVVSKLMKKLGYLDLRARVGDTPTDADKAEAEAMLDELHKQLRATLPEWRTAESEANVKLIRLHPVE